MLFLLSEINSTVLFLLTIKKIALVKVTKSSSRTKDQSGDETSKLIGER